MQVPLTPMQARMWLQEELNPSLPVWNNVTAVRIAGALSEATFCEAFRRVTARQDAFRCHVVAGAKGYELRLARSDGPELKVLDFSTEASPEKTFEAWCQDQARMKFRAGESLHRPALVRLADDQFVFFLGVHHIVSDGESALLLHSELSKAYERLVGPSNRTDAAPAQEARSFLACLEDFACYAKSDQARRDEQFWSDVFPTPAPPITLYGNQTEKKRLLTTFVRRKLDPAAARAILEQSSRIPPPIFFCAALFGYLRIVSGEEDLVVATPFRNRTPEQDGIVGLFMSAYPIRLRVKATDCLEDIAGKCRRAIRDARRHGAWPVSPRQTAHQIFLNYRGRTPSHFASFPVTYLQSRANRLIDSLPGDEVASEAWRYQEALEVNIYRTNDDGFELGFVFNRGVWPDPTEQERACDHFVALIEQSLSNRSAPISDLDILTASERRELLSARAPPEPISATVVDMIHDRTMRSPEQIAVVYDDDEITYRELDRRVGAFTARLRGLGVKEGSLVAVCLDRSVDLVVILLAILRAGAAYVPLDPQHPLQRIGLILSDADPCLLIADRERADELRSQHAIHTLVAGPAMFADDLPVSQLEAGPGPAHLAYVIFTSGSTGRPKGVRVSHGNLSRFLSAMAKQPGLSADDRLLAVTTVSFDIAALELFLPLAVGATVHIAPHAVATNAQSLQQELVASGITVLQATPATFRMLVASGWKGGDRLRLLCGGEALSRDLADDLLQRCAELWNMYGPTETTIWSSVKRITGADEVITIGRPIEGTQMYVLNERQRLSPRGVAGELCIAGEGVALGYHGRDDLTKERFLPNPFSTRPGQRLYRTGDLCRVGENLDFEHLGRIDRQVKIRGFRVELQEIEAVLNTHVKVRQCAVNAYPDATGELTLVAFIVAASASDALDPRELSDYLRQRLPHYMIPVAYEPLDLLPLTPNNKVDRKALTSPLKLNTTSKSQPEKSRPGNDVEKVIAEVWRRLLNVEELGTDDNFFQVGGHSLLAVKASLEIEGATHLIVAVEDIFHAPTVRTLAQRLLVDERNKHGIVVPLSKAAAGPSIFFIHGIHLYSAIADQLSPRYAAFGVHVSDKVMASRSAAEFRSPEHALATSYASLVRKQQPSGPYRLAGLSYGGVLAMETALSLEEQGEDVETVILLDTILISQVRRKWLNWTMDLITGRSGSRKELADDGRSRAAQLAAEAASNGSAGAARALEPTHNTADIFQRLRIRHRNLVARYRGLRKRYSGRVVLVKAQDRLGWSEHDIIPHDLGWGQYLEGDLQIYEIPGDHVSILERPHVDILGSVMREALDARKSAARPSVAIEPANSPRGYI